MRFVIRLKEPHEKKGATHYRVWKDTGVVQNTVKRYAENAEVILESLPATVVTLARYYGVDWRDPAIVEVIDESDETNRHQ